MKRTLLVAACVIAGFTMWLHWPGTENEFLHWDDEPYIDSAAQHTRLSFETIKWAFTTTKICYYHPLALLSHALDCRLWGASSAAAHATNVVLHGANTIAVVLFIWLLLETVGLSSIERFAVASGIGLVFGIHPLQVESVAWVAERKNLLCGLFSLAALHAYVKGWRRVTLLLFMLALLSKPMAVSLPLVMLAMDLYPLQRVEAVGWVRLLKEKAVLITLAALFCGITLITGGLASVKGRGLSDRILIAMRGILVYLWKLIWPAWLSPYYPLAGSISLANKEHLAGFACIVALTVLCVWRWRREPARLAAWIAFLSLIIPVSGLFQSGTQAAADRFMYLAMLPLLLLIAAACVWAWRRLTLLGRLALAALLVCQFAFFAFRTRGQTFVWRNDETLWRAVLVHSPNSGFANAALAQALLGTGQVDEGFAHARYALELASWVPHAHLTMAYACLMTRDYARAESEAQETLRQEPTQAQALFILGSSCSRLGKLDAAYDALKKLLALRPDYAVYVGQSEDLAALRESPEYAAKLPSIISNAKTP